MPTVLRTDLDAYLAKLLDIDAFKDYSPNGLQIEGREKIKTICTAVTASQAVIAETIKKGADALIVHHGYFWPGEPAAICGTRKQRIAALIQNDINLFAYHLPLDCHLSLGNNKGMADCLELTDITQHEAGQTPNLLWTGKLQTPLATSALQKKLHQNLNRKPQVIEGHQRPLQKIAFCTGAAQDFLEQALRLGADAYISGEISERTYYQAMEMGIVYMAAGHHATERFGVQNLGAHLHAAFSLPHQFIDAPNPV